MPDGGPKTVPTTAIKVLLVEDDREDARLVIDLLGESQRAPIITEVAATATAGLALLGNKRYDVILLDYHLPDMDGLAFLAKIEELQFRVPVVVLTGHGDRNLQIRALEAGACDYLEKGEHLTAELLERSCLYAIGLHRKKTENGSGPGVGVLIEQLVGLTRESVRAQSEAASEARETRREFTAGVRAIQRDIENHQEDADRRNAEILGEIRGLTKFRWLLDWIAKNPGAAFIIFLGLVLFVLLVVLIIQFVDLSKVIELKKAVGGLYDGGPGWRT